jgi:MFS transporter, DHA3 family, tetracycline resistance protein
MAAVHYVAHRGHSAGGDRPTRGVAAIRLTEVRTWSAGFRAGTGDLGTGAAICSMSVGSRGLPRRYLTVMMACIGLGMMPFVLLDTSVFPVVIAAALVLGTAEGAGVVIRTTVFQRRVPRDTIGRVASVDMFISLSLLPVSTAIAGPLAAAVSVKAIFAVSAFVPPVTAVVAYYAGRMRQEEHSHPLS